VAKGHRSLTTEYFVQESLVACGVGSEHRRRISWIAERPYEIALFEVERRNMAPNGAGQFDNPPPAASRTIPFSKSQPCSDAARGGERERISRLLGSGRLEPFQKLALLLLDHLERHLELLPHQSSSGRGGSRQREYQVTGASRSWLQEPAVSAAEGPAHGRGQNRICVFKKTA
jgi:hypothetical protein